MALQRFSSRRHRLYDAFLGDRLTGALVYDRIATRQDQHLATGFLSSIARLMTRA